MAIPQTDIVVMLLGIGSASNRQCSLGGSQYGDVFRAYLMIFYGILLPTLRVRVEVC